MLTHIIYPRSPKYSANKANIQRTISPIDNSICIEREYANQKHIQHTLEQTQRAQKTMRQLSMTQRADICNKMIAYLENNRDELAKEITLQMGRPISYSPFEIDGCIQRARHMIDIAETSLTPINIENSTQCQRFIKREPIGTILIIAPWNYPYLTAINTLVPAIMAGNSIILNTLVKHPYVPSVSIKHSLKRVYLKAPCTIYIYNIRKSKKSLHHHMLISLPSPALLVAAMPWYKQHKSASLDWVSSSAEKTQPM